MRKAQKHLELLEQVLGPLPLSETVPDGKAFLFAEVFGPSLLLCVDALSFFKETDFPHNRVSREQLSREFVAKTDALCSLLAEFLCERLRVYTLVVAALAFDWTAESVLVSATEQVSFSVYCVGLRTVVEAKDRFRDALLQHFAVARSCFVGAHSFIVNSFLAAHRDAFVGLQTVDSSNVFLAFEEVSKNIATPVLPENNIFIDKTTTLENDFGPLEKYLYWKAKIHRIL